MSRSASSPRCGCMCGPRRCSLMRTRIRRSAWDGKLAEAFTITGKASRPPLPGLLPEDLRRYYGIVLTPNMLLNLLDDHVVIHTLYQEGPTRTRVTCDWLFDPQVMARPDFDPMDAVEIFD